MALQRSLLLHWIVSLTCCVADSIETLWPIPHQFKHGNKTSILCQLEHITISSNLASSPIVSNATDRLLNYLTNAPSPFTIRSSSDTKSSSKDPKPTTEQLCISRIEIEVDSPDDTLSIDTNESYSLFINESLISIQSGSVYGTVYALITLSQLIRFSTDHSSNIIRNAPFNITDFPAFKYRGLMIDTGRNFLSVALIKRSLMAMALNKMNVLHWHMIDAQAFPFYSKSHPELSQRGSYGHSQTYTLKDIAEIVSVAKNLAIRIVPEWESPGHDTSIGWSHPNLMTCDSLKDQSTCFEAPCGYLNIINETAKQFVFSLFDDLYQDSFDAFPDQMLHLGGDEVSTKCFGENQTSALYDDWMRNRISYLISKGKTPAMWTSSQSLQSDYGQNADDNVDIVMFAYRCGKSRECQRDKYTALKRGYKVVDADSNFYYLDCGFANWQSPTRNTWCGPYRTWAVMYSHSLLDDVPQNESDLASNILGGELCHWGETVDDGNFESRLWIRGAAAAERWWRNEDLTKENIDGVLRRLQIQRYWMLHQGIQSEPLGPKYCLFDPQFCEHHRKFGVIIPVAVNVDDSISPLADPKSDEGRGKGKGEREREEHSMKRMTRESPSLVDMTNSDSITFLLTVVFLLGLAGLCLLVRSMAINSIQSRNEQQSSKDDEERSAFLTSHDATH